MCSIGLGDPFNRDDGATDGIEKNLIERPCL